MKNLRSSFKFTLLTTFYYVRHFKSLKVFSYKWTFRKFSIRLIVLCLRISKCDSSMHSNDKLALQGFPLFPLIGILDYKKYRVMRSINSKQFEFRPADNSSQVIKLIVDRLHLHISIILFLEYFFLPFSCPITCREASPEALILNATIFLKTTQYIIQTGKTTYILFIKFSTNY